MWMHASECPSLSRPNTIPLCIDHTLFSHSSINGHLGCCHLLAIVNNATANMGVQRVVESLLSVPLVAKSIFRKRTRRRLRMQSQGTEDTTAAFSYLFHSTIQSPSLRRPASPLSSAFLPHPSSSTLLLLPIIIRPFPQALLIPDPSSRTTGSFKVDG